MSHTVINESHSMIHIEPFLNHLYNLDANIMEGKNMKVVHPSENQKALTESTI